MQKRCRLCSAAKSVLLFLCLKKNVPLSSSVVNLDLDKLPRVCNHPRHRRCRSHQRTGKQCACPRSLTSLKVTVTGGHCILPGRHFVIIHRQTSRTSRLADSESRLFQYFVQAFLAYLRIYHHEPGTSHATTSAAFLRPFTIEANARKSSIRPLVQAPRNT